MGAAAGPDLISNGLVLMLDVANVKSCQGESTVNYYPCLGTSGYGASADNAVTFPYQGVGGFIRLGYGQTFGNYNILNTDVVYKYNLGTLDCHYHGDAFAIPSGSYLTFTFDYYISSDATNVTGSLLAAIENYGGGALSNGMYMQNTTQGIWQSVTQTSGPTSSSGTQAIYLYPGGCGTKIADTGFILFKNVQVELKSYKTPFVNGTRNTISDISGNKKNHTMVNTPIYSDGPPKFTLDETNGFSYPAAITTSTTCTVVIYYKTTDVTELWIRGNQNNAWYLSASSNGAYYHAACGSPTNYIDLNSASNPYAEGYKDGNYHMFEAKNVDLSNWTYYEWFLYPAPWQLAGSVSMIMVYNRNLTATESAQNFKALRKRFFGAIGGTITDVNGYRIHTFTSSGSFSYNGDLPVDVLVVAGGGGGASGGGGAGGLIYNAGYYTTTSSITVTIGGGGTGSMYSSTNGENSVFGSLTAIGGGGGGPNDSLNGAKAGGSGGGGGATSTTNCNGGTNTTNQGNNGGSVTIWQSPYPAAGGGGAGSVGQNAVSNVIAGNGGIGLSYDISGTPTYYSGGGGGCVWSGGYTNGTGGLGGGGNATINGAANTGGGGGGGYGGGSTYGNGGSGIVIIRYKL